MGHPSGPHFWWCRRSVLLLCLLAFLGGLRGATRRLCLGFLLRGVALRIGLVLLGFTLVVEVVATGHGARDFLGLALHTLDDALDGFFGTAVVVSHDAIPPCGSVR